MIVEQIEQKKKEKIFQYPVHSNRASQLGHPCNRYLVYERTRWQEKVLHNVAMQTIFDEGRIHEEAIIREMKEAGLQVIEQQRSFFWKKYNISGHIDCKVITDGVAVPVEIKTMSQYSFQKINTLQDMLTSDKYYVRMYPCQLTLYLLMDEKEKGIFILKNKNNGQLKEIEMALDYELGEKLLKKAELVNQCVANNTLPERIEYDEDICGECGYLQLCLPEVKRDAVELSEDTELGQKLNKWKELKEKAKEFEVLDKEIKAIFQEKEKIIIGDFLVTGKWITRKPQIIEIKETKYWKINIQSLKGKENNDE